MKLNFFFNCVLLSLLLPNIMNSQTGSFTLGTGDTLIITPGIPGNFETVINSDTSNGNRNDKNRVYVLQAGGIYYENAGLNVIDSTGTVSIVGVVPNGKQKPVLLHSEKNGVQVTSSNIKGSLTIKNIQYESEDLQGVYPSNAEGDFFISGSNQTIDVENSLFEFCNIALINAQFVPQGLKAYFRGNYFRDYFNGSQWWAGRAFYAKVPVDTLVFENNTSTGGGLLVLQQNSLTAFALINHNTIINSIKYPFLDASFLECYFTNNLIVNSNLSGDDTVNIVAAKTEDPDGLPVGIIGVDTINCKLIQPRYLLNGKPNQALVGIDQIKWFAGDNIVVADTTKVFENYIHGLLDDGIATTASSYLDWSGKGKAPFRVINVPEIFVNSRAVALAAEHKNIANNQLYPNSVYNIPVSALGFAQPTLDTAMAKVFIQFNRSKNGYGVPNAAVPVAYPGAKNTNPYARFAFGDFDPTTIPGPGGEEYPAATATGGITSFTDLKENFAVDSSNADLYSMIDGLPIGSLIWLKNPPVFNEAALFNSITIAYQNNCIDCEGVNTTTGKLKVSLNNYPNPFSNNTTLSFTLPNPAHVNLSVYNLQGKIISTLIDEDLPEGTHSEKFTPSGLPSGIYLYQLRTNETVITGKMVFTTQ